MAGHSKWNNIKNRKGAADQARAKVFNDIAKTIRIAVKEGKSGDPAVNPRLRLPLDKARAANMPKDKIQRAIDSGLGRRDGKAIQETLYEAYGPGGAGLLIAAMTDNPQRTSAEMKFILSRNNGSLGGPGSVQFLFSRSQDGNEYQPTMPLTLTDETIINQLIELVNELENHDDVEDVYTSATWAGQLDEQPTP